MIWFRENVASEIAKGTIKNLIMTTRSFLHFRCNIVASSTVHSKDSLRVFDPIIFGFITVVFISAFYLFCPFYLVLCQLSLSFVTALCMYVPSASVIRR